MNKVIRGETESKIITCHGDEILCNTVDLPLLTRFTWQYKRGKVFTRYWEDKYKKSKYKILFMSRLLMQPKDCEDVDHIYHNRLDHRRDKLRVCTRSQNNVNKGIKSNNTSGVTGVSFSKRYQKWFIQVMVNGKRKGAYRNTLDEAMALRKQWEEEYYGDFVYKEVF